MTITSSIFSFVDFNAEPDACNDQQMALPAVNNFGIKFQFKLLNANAGIAPWAAPVVNGSPVLGAKVLCDSQCGRLTIPIPFSAYPIIIAGTGTLPAFDNGTYDTPALFLANLISQNEFDWKMDATHIYADSCCIPPYVGTISVTGIEDYSLVSTLMLDFIFFFANIPALTLDGSVDLGACFNYGVFEFNPSFNPGSLISPSSNPFKRMAPGCFLSFVEYWSERNSFDFNYGCESHNTVWLPVYLTDPTNPTNESVYIESSGRRRVLAASIDEEYVLKTDHLTQWLHRKIEGMLQHDFKLFTNSYFGLVAESLTKSGPYNKAWNKEAIFTPTATAESKLIKNLSYFNSGCCVTDLDCCPPVEIVCGQINGLALVTERNGADWEVHISACTYLEQPTVPQTVEIFYRERYSIGAYTSAGTVAFDISGDLTSTPDPFVIGPLSDAWQEVEIKVVNACGSDDYVTNINNPCETMAGVIATAVEEDPPEEWALHITDVVYSNWPSIGSHALVISYREYGSGSGWTSAGTFNLTIAAGHVVTLLPSGQFYVGSFPGVAVTWERVEIKIEYGCDKVLYQVFSNPWADCIAVTEIEIVDITSTTADATWPAVSPAPSGLYDWELYTGSFGGTLVDSGLGYWNPGSLVLGLFSLTPNTHYYFRVRGNCNGDGYSSWAEAEFDTLP
jgi:hypothetical protein